MSSQRECEVFRIMKGMCEKHSPFYLVLWPHPPKKAYKIKWMASTFRKNKSKHFLINQLNSLLQNTIQSNIKAGFRRALNYFMINSSVCSYASQDMGACISCFSKLITTRDKEDFSFTPLHSWQCLLWVFYLCLKHQVLATAECKISKKQNLAKLCFYNHILCTNE